MARTKQDLESKVHDEYPEFYAEVQTATAEQLDDRLAQLAKDREQVAEAKSADEALAEAKETAKQHAAPYRDAIKLVSLKSRYIIKLLKDRGGQ